MTATIAAQNQKKAQTIMIVDDTAANVLLLEKMLAERGYRTQSASSGEAALDLVHVQPPDLILLDITMPGMNGYEVCRQLKADTAVQDIPVIFLSALHETIEKVIAFNAGGVDYVTKPFQFEEVFARIKTHLQLRWLEKLRADLTHMIVHDLRNPLTVILASMDMLALTEAGRESANTRELITSARQSSEEMLDMISSILDVSKMDSGAMNLHLETFKLNTLIGAIVATTLPLTEARTVTFDTTGSSTSITADIVLIRRVLQNLLSNALKFSPVGGNVRITAIPALKDVRISITDSGPGIASEHHERIFEKFGQVSGKTSRLGTGLGLTFCKLAVEAHGGRIGVESIVGQGSTFWLALPQQLSSTVALAS